jgi:hypothetical protein
MLKKTSLSDVTETCARVTQFDDTHKNGVENATSLLSLFTAGLLRAIRCPARAAGRLVGAGQII